MDTILYVTNKIAVLIGILFLITINILICFNSNKKIVSKITIFSKVLLTLAVLNLIIGIIITNFLM